MNKRAYLLREALVSAVINGLISVGFFVAVFGRTDPVPVWGMGNYAFDFIPQSFAVAFMSVLVPCFLANKAIAGGKFPGMQCHPARSIAGRAVTRALAALVIGAGIVALLLLLSGWKDLPSAPAFAFKIAYGASLGATVTYRSVGRMIA